MQGPDSVPAGQMSEAASSKTPHTPPANSCTRISTLPPGPPLCHGRSRSHTSSQVRDSEWWRLHRETPVRGKGAVYSTCTFNEQFLPMTTQQRSGQEGSKVHKYLPQQRRHLLQSALQLRGDAAGGKGDKKKGRREIQRHLNARLNEEQYSAGRRNVGGKTWVGEGGVRGNRSRAGKTCRSRKIRGGERYGGWAARREKRYVEKNVSAAGTCLIKKSTQDYKENAE